MIRHCVTQLDLKLDCTGYLQTRRRPSTKPIWAPRLLGLLDDIFYPFAKACDLIAIQWALTKDLSFENRDAHPTSLKDFP